VLVLSINGNLVATPRIARPDQWPVVRADGQRAAGAERRRGDWRRGRARDEI